MKKATPTTAAGEKVDLVMPSTKMGRTVEAVLAGFQGYRFLNLTTFRKSGIPVVTTVLFAVANCKIYVWTTKDSRSSGSRKHAARGRRKTVKHTLTRAASSVRCSLPESV